MADDLRQRYADAVLSVLDEWARNPGDEGQFVGRVVHAVMVVRNDEMEQVCEWRDRAEAAEHILSQLTAETPRVPDGTGDDTARRGWTERTVDQWRKYAAHWRAHAETAGRRLLLTRDRLDALIAAGGGATTDTLRELRALADGQEGDRGGS